MQSDLRPPTFGMPSAILFIQWDSYAGTADATLGSVKSSVMPIRSRRLRAIGDPNHRFEEDHLRLLRAIRFAARFELAIEPGTAEAMRSHASLLTRISPERIAEELGGRLPRPAALARVPCYTKSVANLTLSVDDEVLKRARMRALEQGTSVNANPG